MSHYSCQAVNIVHANFTRVPAYWDTSCPRVVRQDYENVKKVILTLLECTGIPPVPVCRPARL
jgi:hypothetical protein